MRSYKDCLVEYLEVQSFKKLNLHWGSFFLTDLVENADTFHIINGIPPVENVSTLSLYGDVVPSEYQISHFDLFGFDKRSANYKTLIVALKELISIKLKDQFGDKLTKESCFSLITNFPSSNNYFSFSNYLRKVLSKCGIEAQEINTFIYEGDSQISRIIQFIEDFFNAKNYDLNKPLYKFNQSTTVVGSYTFDFNHHCNTNCDDHVLLDKVIYPSSPFFKGNDEGLDALNSKSMISPIRVTGTLHDLQRRNVKCGDWFNQSLIDELYSCESTLFENLLPSDIKEKIQAKLESAYRSFYTASEFDITIEINNSFDSSEVELLKNIDFSMFPFYLNSQHEHYKWIDLNENGFLRIRIKSKKPQVTIVAAEVEKNKMYVID